MESCVHVFLQALKHTPLAEEGDVAGLRAALARLAAILVERDADPELSFFLLARAWKSLTVLWDEKEHSGARGVLRAIRELLLPQNRTRLVLRRLSGASPEDRPATSETPLSDPDRSEEGRDAP